jgi:hypothetical protein
MRANKSRSTYALIYFENKKTLKKPYETAAKAFYDYESEGCILAELYNSRGNKLSSMGNNFITNKIK